MQKIILAALKAAFPSLNLGVVLEIVEATGNPVVATEMLLGIYEEPSIPTSAKIRGSIHTFVSYDKWKNIVRSKYLYTKERSNYFATQEEADSAASWDSSGDRYQTESLPFRRVFEVLEESHDTNSLEDWLKYSLG
jgi:hypothetical protein